MYDLDFINLQLQKVMWLIHFKNVPLTVAMQLGICNMTFSYCFIITRCCFTGLKLIIDIQVDQYIVALAENAGIRFLIHNPNNMPFIED